MLGLPSGVVALRARVPGRVSCLLLALSFGCGLCGLVWLIVCWTQSAAERRDLVGVYKLLAGIALPYTCPWLFVLLPVHAVSVFLFRGLGLVGVGRTCQWCQSYRCVLSSFTGCLCIIGIGFLLARWSSSPYHCLRSSVLLSCFYALFFSSTDFVYFGAALSVCVSLCAWSRLVVFVASVSPSRAAVYCSVSMCGGHAGFGRFPGGLCVAECYSPSDGLAVGL